MFLIIYIYCIKVNLRYISILVLNDGVRTNTIISNLQY